MTRRTIDGRGCRLACALVAALTALTLPGFGCRQTAIRSNDERSQYDRYDAIRNERAQQYVFDAYGKRRPNLRGRLLDR